MTPALPPSDALIGVVAGWWAPAGAARTGEAAHRMARSTHTGRRGKTALCGVVLTQLQQVPDGSTARPACTDCSDAAARIPRHDAVTEQQTLPPPSPPRPSGGLGASQENTPAARMSRRRAFREHWMTSDRARGYAESAYDPPDPALLAATALPQS